MGCVEMERRLKVFERLNVRKDLDLQRKTGRWRV